jgi:hypothetical protein
MHLFKQNSEKPPAQSMSAGAKASVTNQRPQQKQQMQLCHLANNNKAAQLFSSLRDSINCSQLVKQRSQFPHTVLQCKKRGDKIKATFNAPVAEIPAVFTDSNVFGANRFDYSVRFDVDEVGNPGTEEYRIGEFRQYYRYGYKEFGKKSDDYKNDWVEDSLQNAKYGYRGKNTHSSTYVESAEGTGDVLSMWDKPEVQGINKPDEIDYKTEFKGDIVAVDKDGIATVINSCYWTVKGLGTVDKTGDTYLDIRYSQLVQPRPKSRNKSKRLRKEQAGKYTPPTSG